jgi:hypothetical protein
MNFNFEGFVCDYQTGQNGLTTAKWANVVQTASSLEKTHNGKQGTLAKQATKSIPVKPPAPAKAASNCIGYKTFKTLSTLHKCPIHGKGYNHQLGKCQSLLFELNKRGYKVIQKDGKPNLPHANQTAGKNKTNLENTPDNPSISNIFAANKMTRSTYAGAAQPATASFTRIALGWSDVSNALVFYNWTLQKFGTSADYLLDANKSIGLAFPSLHYDGGIHIRLYSNPKLIGTRTVPLPLVREL